MSTKQVLRTLSVGAVLLFLSIFASAQNQTVSAKYDNAEMKAVLHDIEVQTGLSLVIDDTVPGLDRSVTESFENTPVSEVLGKLFGSDVSIVFQNTFAIIKASPKEQPKAAAPAPEAVNDEQTPVSGTVTGVVVDETNEPIIGAAVLVKGSKKGVTTDIDGKFTLSDVNPESVLQVTALSYKDKEVTVGRQSDLKIVLQSDNMLLDEVVVVGFGTQKKVNLTGSVATVDAKNLSQRPVASATQALQGLDPAVMIT